MERGEGPSVIKFFLNKALIKNCKFKASWWNSKNNHPFKDQQHPFDSEGSQSKESRKHKWTLLN